MHNVVDLVLADYLIITRTIGHIELLVVAREVHLFVTDISCHDVVLADNCAKSVHQGETNLTLAPSYQNSASMLQHSRLMS